MPEVKPSGVQGSLECPPIVIVASAEKAILLLLACLAFVCLGVFIISNGSTRPGTHVIAYAGIFFSGGGALTSFWALVAPPRLTLSPEGLALFSGFRTRHYAWPDFSKFVICRSSRGNTGYVGFTFELRRGEECGVTRRLFGVDGGIGGLWPMSPSTLVDLLNSAKDKWSPNAKGEEVEAREEGTPIAPDASGSPRQPAT
ncbi:PH domain-containing protein [Pleomorphomonas diazotrophica]|nr:PH domain-containing protein [Pleomorphomonas diazotrophica]